jgi:hypothetical protein
MILLAKSEKTKPGSPEGEPGFEEFRLRKA